MTVEHPVPTLAALPMSKVSLRRLLSRLAALALTTGSVGPAGAAGRLPATAPRDLDLADDGDLDADLPIDREQLDESDAAAALGRSLALALTRSSPLSATHLASTWALSHDPLRRLALAHALEWPFHLLGDRMVIDHLARDPDPRIRAEIARAAWARRATGGDPGVLDRLAEDPDPTVAAIARGAR